MESQKNNDQIQFEFNNKLYYFDLVKDDISSLWKVYITNEVGQPIFQSSANQNGRYNRFELIYDWDSNFSDNDLQLLQQKINDMFWIKNNHFAQEISDSIK